MWSVYLFPLLMGIVYFFGGIAKMNYDWLIRAMPLHMWLGTRSNMPVLGFLWEQEITAYVMAWGGMLLDFTVPFLLLHRRLRWLALGLLAFFHATNHLIFNIGIFPYLSMVLTSLFFAPDWPKRFVRWVATFRAGALVRRWLLNWQGVVGNAPNGKSSSDLSSSYSESFWQFSWPRAKPVLLILSVLVIVHCLLPIRHWSFDSDVNWSEEGHRYSWRMMLRSKHGSGTFMLVDKSSGITEVVYPGDSLSQRQHRKMVTHPDMILQYAHHLQNTRITTGQRVEVYGDFTVGLNGRDWQIYIDPKVDLAATEWSWFSAKSWVLKEIVDEK